jgi:DNA-binding NarL/FixJ family response regulator
MKKSQRATKQVHKKSRILLVDDHPMVRERLAEAIEGDAGFLVCGEAADRLQAMEIIPTAHPDIVIVDLTLKNSDGLELIKDIHVRWPDLAILVLSMHDERLYAERVLRAGARGYITKQEATKKIMLALETVRRGEVYLSEKVALHIARQATRQPRARMGLTIDQLSDREFQVFQLLGQGRSSSEIAAELHLALHTVETYRARIKEKLNLKNGHELLRHAIQWSRFGAA